MNRKPMKVLESIELFNTNKFLFYILGLSVWETGTIYKHLKKFVLSVCLLYIALQMADLYLNVRNFDDFSSYAHIICMYSLALLRYSQLYRNRQIFTEIIDILGRSSFKTHTVYGETIIQRGKTRNRRLIFMFQSLSIISSIFYAITPLLDWKTKPYEFAQRIWIPFDVTKHHLYPVVYFITTIISASMDFLTVAQDLLIGSFFNFLCCHLEILSISIQRLVEDIEQEARNLQIGYSRLDLEEQFSSSLKDYIRQHQVLLRCADTLNGFYRFIMLSQFALSIFMICSVMYQTTQTMNFSNIIPVISMLLWLWCSIIEIFIFCSWGEELTVQSENVAQSCYFSSWYRVSSPNNRKLLQIFMIRAQRPVEMTVGGLYTLSNASFMMLAKTSYSVFNLMLKAN